MATIDPAETGRCPCGAPSAPIVTVRGGRPSTLEFNDLCSAHRTAARGHRDRRGIPAADARAVTLADIAAAKTRESMLAGRVEGGRAALTTGALDFDRSRSLGDAIAAAEDARLALHGFVPATHGCYTRAGCGLTFSRRRALAVCAAETRLGVDFFARDERGQGQQQASEQGDSSVHGPGVRTSAVAAKVTP